MLRVNLSIRAAQWGSLSLFLLNSAALFTYHHIVIPVDAAGDDPSGGSKGVPQLLDASSFSTTHRILFVALVQMAFELLDFCTKRSGKWLKSPNIPVRGKHLDELRSIDILFIGISKANTAPFTYFYLRYCWNAAGSIIWDIQQMNMINTVVALALLFVLFDVSYGFMHWVLHWQSLYRHVHKHHHIQKAPSRANVDAVNVHPLEFVLGEYNHLLVLWVCAEILHLHVHVVSAALFLAVGGALAGINHTRFDVRIRLPGVHWTLYDSKAHDVHHRIPNSNYGQYTMLWDRVFGTYRPYNEKDRIVPDAQLDPATGKTVVKKEA